MKQIKKIIISMLIIITMIGNNIILAVITENGNTIYVVGLDART